MAGKRGKKEPPKNEIDPLKSGVHIIGAGEVVEQPITDTIETNYFPYAMSVIMSRAIPEDRRLQALAQKDTLYNVQNGSAHRCVLKVG